MPDDDRDALSWDGDADDDTLVTREPEAPAQAAAATETVAAEAPAAASGDRTAKVVSALFLLIAVAWAIGWVVVAFSNGTTSGIDLLALALYQLGEVLAMITPVIWWLLARRLAPNPVPWWIAGAVVTAPWPLVVGMLA